MVWGSASNFEFLVFNYELGGLIVTNHPISGVERRAEVCFCVPLWDRLQITGWFWAQKSAGGEAFGYHTEAASGEGGVALELSRASGAWGGNGFIGVSAEYRQGPGCKG